MIPQCLACHICTDLWVLPRWLLNTRMRGTTGTMWGPRSIAKLAHITPITMAFRTYNELVTGANLNQLITEGGPNCTSPFLFGLYHQLPVLFANLELDRAWLIPTFFCSLFVYLLHIAIYLLEIHSLLRFQSGVQSHIGYIYIYMDIGFPRDSSMCSKELIYEKRVQEFHHVWGVLRVEAN